MANRLIAMERFETILGIYDHDVVDRQKPSPLSLHTQWSDRTSDSLYSREISKLIKRKIPQRTGMSIMELLDLPMETYRIVLRNCAQLESLDADVAEDIANELTNMQNRM